MRRALRALGRILRRTGRWLLRLSLILALMLAALAAPAAYTELMCHRPGDSAPPEQRSATASAARYPGQYIADVQDDYARVTAQSDPHAFAYLPAVAGYWQSLCQLHLAVADRGGFSAATRSAQYLNGTAFTGYWLLKGLYEESAGRLMVMLRGKDRSALDELSAAQAAAQAASLLALPDQPYDFASDAAALDSAPPDGLRGTERRLALRFDYGLRDWLTRLPARLTGAGAETAPPLRSLVTGVAGDWLAQQPGITVLAADPGGISIETAGGRDFTAAARLIALEGGTFTSIGGTDRILLSLLSPGPETGMLLSAPRQGARDWRHLAEVPVADLAGAIRALRAGPRQLEHIFAP